MIELGELCDRERCATALVSAGFEQAAATRRSHGFVQAAGLLEGAPSERVLALWIPGRIEVLGKHTDYVGGRSLLAATEQGFCVVARPRNDARLVMHDVRSGQNASLRISTDLVPDPGAWTNYPATVARRLARNFDAVGGADVAFVSDLPQAAGMSSSSAMVVGFGLALMIVNDLFAHPAYASNITCLEDLAGYLGTNENGQTFGDLDGDRGVGTFGGSEDHTAILCSRAETLSGYRYAPVAFEARIPWPEDYCFAIGGSGVTAEKTGSAMALYNRASGLAAEAAAVWRRTTGGDHPHLASAVLAAGAERVREVLAAASGDAFPSTELVQRFDHFVAESDELVPGACRALESGDLEAFGRLVDRSQAMGRDLLGNQTEETVYLARRARELGATAASAFGAGFGGSVWAMVETASADALIEGWRTAYASKFPQHATRAAFFTTRPGPSAVGLGPCGSPWK